jgi:hypothetical protein
MNKTMFQIFRRTGLATVLVALLGCPLAMADFSFTHGGHSYLVVETDRTWAAAAADAITRQVAGVNGHLAIIDNAAENQAIFAQLTNVANIPLAEYGNTQAPDGGNGFFVWIAAADIVTEGSWIWDGDGNGTGTQFWQGTGASGSIVGGLYNNWGHNPSNPTQQQEPDNGASGLQDAGGIGLQGWPRGFAGEWNDVRADNTLYYVVEFAAVPEPSGIVLLGLGGAWFLSQCGNRSRRSRNPQ